MFSHKAFIITTASSGCWRLHDNVSMCTNKAERKRKATYPLSWRSVGAAVPEPKKVPFTTRRGASICQGKHVVGGVEQGREGQDRASLVRAGQGRAGQGRAGQGRAGQDRIGQDGTG